jgi:hypothetical protein
MSDQTMNVWAPRWPIEIKAIHAERHAVDAVISTPDVDRDGDMVPTEVIKSGLSRFLDNPVMLENHQFVRPDGTSGVVGHWEDLQVQEKCFTGTAVFDIADPHGARLWAKYAQKHQRAFSPAFVNKGSQKVNVGGRMVRKFQAIELVEISAVPVGANAKAIMKGMQAIADADDENPMQALADLLTPTIEKAIRIQLEAEPGGRLQALIEDVVEALLRRRGQGFSDDDGGIAAPGTAAEYQGLVKALESVTAAIA